jgi:phosphatidylinositol alpha-mannosyltransferase
VRIGLVCPYDMGRPGGVQDQVVRLSRWLKALGHEVRVVAPGTIDLEGFVGVGPASVVPANGAQTPIALSPAVAGRVLEGLDGLDVVHVHEPLMPQVSLAALRKAKAPLVGTLHADVSPVGEWLYRLGRPLLGRLLKRLAVVTAVSPIAARVLGEMPHVRIIPNGIDHDLYLDGEKDPNLVVFLGRNDPRKGLPVLLSAWPEIRARHPRASLLVMGCDAAEELEGVTFAGRVSELEKRMYLGRASIYCAPNLSGESFGIVVVEAMAAGCAVVASGLRAFVRVAGDTARFVAPGDSSGIANAVVDLLEDPDRARTMGDAARASSTRFGRDAVATAYMCAYEDAIAAT